MKFKKGLSFFLVISLVVMACKKDTKLASEDGAAINPEQVSALVRPEASDAKKMSQEEISEVLMKEPYNLSEKNPKALTVADVAILPEDTRQAIAVLVNRGILEWKKGLLYDYNGIPTSKGMIADFMARYQILQEQEKLSEDSKSKDKKASDEKAEEKKEESKDSKDSSIFTLENAGIAVALIASLGTFMWGFREYKLHSKDISAIKKAQMDLKNVTNINSLTKEHKAHLKKYNIPPTMDEIKKFTSKKPGGSLLDFNAPRNGKFLYAPILFATALGTLGVAGAQIAIKFSKDDE